MSREQRESTRERWSEGERDCNNENERGQEGIEGYGERMQEREKRKNR